MRRTVSGEGMTASSSGWMRKSTGLSGGRENFKTEHDPGGAFQDGTNRGEMLAQLKRSAGDSRWLLFGGASAQVPKHLRLRFARREIILFAKDCGASVRTADKRWRT